MNKKSPLSAFLAAILIGGLVLASAMLFGTVQASTGFSGIPKLSVPDDSGIPRPSAPEFTLKYVDNSYDVPPTTTSSTDPYTGKTTNTTIPGYHVKNVAIEVIITNQPFPSTVGGNALNLYYNVRTKGYFGEDWDVKYTFSESSSGTLQAQSGSEYTVLSFPADSYPFGGVVDFQVEAILGYQYSYDEYFYNQQPHLIPIRVSTFIYETSGWSKTQNITIGERQTPTPSPATTPSPTPYTAAKRTEQETIAGAAITAAVIVAGLGLIIYLMKRK